MKNKTIHKVFHQYINSLIPIFLLLGGILGIVGIMASSTDMDPSFNTGIPVGFNIGSPRALGLQNDGKLIIGGNFAAYQGSSPSNLVRLNNDGSLDTSFDSVGSFPRGNGATVDTVDILHDSKILIGGSFPTPQGRGKSSFYKLNNDGSVDTTFHTGDFNGVYSMLGSVELSNNNLIVIGPFTSMDGETTQYIAGLTADGYKDPDFNNGGVGFNTYAMGILKQSDDKLILWGYFTSYNGESANRIIRLNPDGSRDYSFDIGDGFSSAPGNIKLQNDGKILIVGPGGTYNGQSIGKMIRLNTDGTLDNSFANTDFCPTESNGNCGSSFFSIESDNKIIVFGAYSTDNRATQQQFTARLNNDGTIDNTFPSSLFDGYVSNLAIDSNGDYFVIGQFKHYQENAVNGIVKVKSDWTRDPLFLVGNGFDTDINSIIEDNDGHLIIFGGATSYQGQNILKVTRLNRDGTKDTSFNIASKFDDSPSIGVIQSDGKIIVGGKFSTYDGQSGSRIVRLEHDGTIDQSFNAGNTISSSDIQKILIQNDGKILVLGNDSSLFRLNSDGSLDFSKTLYNTHNLAIQPDGKILYVSRYRGGGTDVVFRLNSDGSDDTTFNSSYSSYSYVRSNNQIHTIAVQNDGKFYIGGQFQEVNGSSYKNIVRLNADGTIDNSFAPGTSFNGDVHSILPNIDGTVIVGGTFTTYKGQTANNIIELNSDGTRNIVFDFGIGFGNGGWMYSQIVNKIMRSQDGGIFVGGNFSKYKDGSAGYLIKLYGDIPVVTLPNTTDTTTVKTAFTDKGYTEDNGTLVGSVPISLGVTDGNILTTLNLSNNNIKVSIPGDTQIQDQNNNSYNGLISLPVNKDMYSINDELVISSINIGSNSNAIYVNGGLITISIPAPGQNIGNTVNIYYSTDNGVTWYFETTTTVINKSGDPYVEFTTDHFGDFAITIPGPDKQAPIISLNGANPMNLILGDTYTEPGATAFDIRDGDLSQNVIISGSVDSNTEGTYIISYNVSDAAGNKASEVTRTIHVAPESLVEINSGNIVDTYNCPIDATSCDLSNQGIQRIAVNTFINHTSLETLYLNNNDIRALQSGSFNGLNTLIELNLSSNRLNSIKSGDFNGIPSLQSLYLYNNQLTSIDSQTFGNITSINQLDISNNNFSTIPNNVFLPLTNLQYLYMGGNQITSISKIDINKFPNTLQELGFEGNTITFIEAGAFEKLSNLQYLYLYNNQLPSLQTEMFSGLNSLIELSLYNNQISSIADGTFRGLANIQRLYLYENKLTSLTNGVFDGLDSIQQIDLYNNPLISVQTGVFSELPNLSSFSLYNSCDNKNISLGNYVCSDPQYTDETSCLAAGWCTNGVSNNQNTCESVGFCRDGESLDKSTCEANGSSWNQIYSRITSNSWYSNGFSSQMDLNYCSILNTEDTSLFTQELLNKNYTQGGGLLSLGSDYYIGNYALRFAPGFVNEVLGIQSMSKIIPLGGESNTPLSKFPESFSYSISSLKNQFLANTIMQSSNTNGYSQDYYNNVVEVEYPLGTEILSGGQEFVGVLHNPTLFNTGNIPQISGAISLIRFGALTHGVTFSAPITLRIPALGRNIGDKVSIYSSDKENIYLSDPSWTFEQTGTVVDINGTPYVQFTTTHASWYVLSSKEPSTNTDTGNTGGNSGGGSSGGSSGGGSSGGGSTHNTATTQQTHGAADLTGEVSLLTGASIEGSTFSPDINEAYLWAYGLGITTIPTIQEANIEGKVYRSHLAKMLTEYATKVLNKTPDSSIKCQFSDIGKQSQELQSYIVKACQLGLMGRKADGSVDKRFRPSGTVTRAQFGTVLSRLLFGNTYNVPANENVWRYSKHLEALKKVGVMTKITNPLMNELRGNIFIMMMRTNKILNK